MTIISRFKLPTPEQAIQWGLFPHMLGIAKHVLGGSRKGLAARAWLRAYLLQGGPIGDADVFLGLYGPSSYDLDIEAENELYLGDQGISSTEAAKRSSRGVFNLRAIDVRKGGRPLWRVVLEESMEGSIARLWLRNFLAQEGEINCRQDFFRGDRERSMFGMYHADLGRGGRGAEVARNLIVTLGACEDRREASLTGSDLIADVGAFEAQQRRLARTFHVLPHAVVRDRVCAVLPESGATLGLEELHILADLEYAEERGSLHG